jgi:hypothetical protein
VHSAALRALLIILPTGPPETAARVVLDQPTTEHARRVLVREGCENGPALLLW